MIRLSLECWTTSIILHNSRARQTDRWMTVARRIEMNEEKCDYAFMNKHMDLGFEARIVQRFLHKRCMKSSEPRAGQRLRWRNEDSFKHHLVLGAADDRIWMLMAKDCAQINCKRVRNDWWWWRRCGYMSGWLTLVPPGNRREIAQSGKHTLNNATHAHPNKSHRMAESKTKGVANTENYSPNWHGRTVPQHSEHRRRFMKGCHFVLFPHCFSHNNLLR